MKILAWILLCSLFIVACAANESNLHNATQEKLKNRLKASSAESDSTHQPSTEAEQVHILMFPEISSPGTFSATLAIDQKNKKENLSIKDLTTAITAFALSTGFTKVDCLLDQLACFAKSDMFLSFKPGNAPETIRVELVTHKTATDRIADAAVNLFFEGLLMHLQQPRSRTSLPYNPPH